MHSGAWEIPAEAVFSLLIWCRSEKLPAAICFQSVANFLLPFNGGGNLHWGKLTVKWIIQFACRIKPVQCWPGHWDTCILLLSFGWWNRNLFIYQPVSMVLCFRFGTKTLLITHQCFSPCWAVLAHSQRLFSFLCCPASKEAGGAQGPGIEQGWPQLTKGMPHSTWHHGQQ